MLEDLEYLDQSIAMEINEIITERVKQTKVGDGIIIFGNRSGTKLTLRHYDDFVKNNFRSCSVYKRFVRNPHV